MKNNCNKNVIILNGAFVGGYGKSGENLPHEMINFFKADNDKFYVYITPSGVLDSSILAEQIKGIIFVRTAGDCMVEVLAKAELGKDGQYYTQGFNLKSKQMTKFDAKKYKKITNNENFEENEKIKYAGATIQKIHEKNKEDNNIFVTMKVEKICLPKKTFYLTYKKNSEKQDIIYVADKKINNQSMLAYYYDGDDGYITLNQIIEDKNEEYWKDFIDTPKFELDKVENNKSIFKAIKKQDDEVVFSNMFFYLFREYPKFLKYFVKRVLEIDLNDDFILEREKDRMDLRIIDKNHYIIIENKLKSPINGMHKFKDSKEESDVLNKNGFQAKMENDNKKYISQLSDYYEKAQKYLNTNNKENIELKAFIFAPNYSLINVGFLKDYLCGDKYKIINYSTIYDVFSKLKDEDFKNYDIDGNDKIYFEDFFVTMKKHIVNVDDEYRIELMQRLKKRIEEINNNGKKDNA